VKPAAFVSAGPSLESTLEELRALDAKVFATAEAMKRLDKAGIRAQELGDPLGIERIFKFGHKEIHLFGFDCSIADENATRLCFDNEVFFTTKDLATHAHMLVRAVLALTDRGAVINIHGKGMFQQMVQGVIRDAQERVLTAVYDMHVSPPTYEVMNFLAAAEKYRVDNGFTCIDVMFFPGPMHGFRDDGLPPSPAQRESMLHRLCVSGARLLPSVRNVHVMKKRVQLNAEDIFPPDWTNDRPRFAYGPKLQKYGHRCLTATAAAKDAVKGRFPKPYVSITLREAEYWPNRNSNIAAWSRAARFLRDEGYVPVIVPDTNGRSRIHEGEEFSPAAWDVDLRMALYEGAVLNLFISNGPMALPMLAAKPCPYITFIIQDETSPATQKEFLTANGLAVGEQWSDHGLTLWEDDTPENVIRALNGWFQKKVAA
jgi:hypothetical protein